MLYAKWQFPSIFENVTLLKPVSNSNMCALSRGFSIAPPLISSVPNRVSPQKNCQKRLLFVAAFLTLQQCAVLDSQLTQSCGLMDKAQLLRAEMIGPEIAVFVGKSNQHPRQNKTQFMAFLRFQSCRSGSACILFRKRSEVFFLGVGLLKY